MPRRSFWRRSNSCLIKQKKDDTKTWNDNTKNKAVQQPSSQGQLSQPTKSFLAAKEQSFSKDIQFLQAHVPTSTQSTTTTKTWIWWSSTERIKISFNCHLTGHQRRNCKSPAHSGVSDCSLQSKYPEMVAPVIGLI